MSAGQPMFAERLVSGLTIFVGRGICDTPNTAVGGRGVVESPGPAPFSSALFMVIRLWESRFLDPVAVLMNILSLPLSCFF